MHKILLSAAASAFLLGSATPAFTETAATAPAAPAYSTSESSIGTLLDNPATKAVLEKHVPALVGNAQIEMARGMTLKAIQAFAGDTLSDAKLAEIEADLAKIPAK
jgi:hypothetical protein